MQPIESTICSAPALGLQAGRTARCRVRMRAEQLAERGSEPGTSYHNARGGNS